MQRYVNIPLVGGRGGCSEGCRVSEPWNNRPVQILVAVASIPVRPWKTEVEQGSAARVVRCGSVGPKAGGRRPLCRKGSRLIFRHRINR